MCFIVKNLLLARKIKDISCIGALYADIDVKGDAHAEKSLPETTSEATSFLNNLDIKPSIIVNSGNGIHGYWLLKEPFNIENTQDRSYIVSIFKGFGRYINLKAKKLGKIESAV